MTAPPAERFVGEYRLLEPLPSWGAELWLPQALFRAEHVLSRQSVLVALLHPEEFAEPVHAGTPGAAAGDPDAPRSASGGATSAPAHTLLSGVGSRAPVWDRALRLAGIDHHALCELVESNSPRPVRARSAPQPTRHMAFLAWQLERGPTLRQRLTAPASAAPPQAIPFAPAEALRIVQHVAEGIDAIHSREEIHGGLCPANVLLTPIGARLLAPGFCTFNHRQAAGSADGWIYRAPEQLPGGGGALGPACDVWALGAILCELLTGKPLSRAAAFPASGDAPPGDVGELAQRCQRLDAEGREQLLGEVESAVRGALATMGNGDEPLPAEIAEILAGTLRFEAALRTRADEVAQLAHLAARSLSARHAGRVQARAAAATSSASAEATRSQPSASSSTVAGKPRLDDWSQSRSWLQERRARFEAEEEDTPSWFLWLLPAAVFVILLLLLLVVFLAVGSRGGG